MIDWQVECRSDKNSEEGKKKQKWTNIEVNNIAP